MTMSNVHLVQIGAHDKTFRQRDRVVLSYLAVSCRILKDPMCDCEPQKGNKIMKQLFIFKR
jgi:hypothetical protein